MDGHPGYYFLLRPDFYPLGTSIQKLKTQIWNNLTFVLFVFTKDTSRCFGNNAVAFATNANERLTPRLVEC